MIRHGQLASHLATIVLFVLVAACASDEPNQDYERIPFPDLPIAFTGPDAVDDGTSDTPPDETASVDDGMPTDEAPSCDDEMLPDVTVNTEGEDYVITLESETLSVYEGDVRAVRFYEGEAPLIADILVTTGDYSDPECDVGQSGHQYYWRGCNPEEGTITNIHAVPLTSQIADSVYNVEVWQRVAVVGLEVARIDFNDGRWWTDAGCNTLVIVELCIVGD